MPQNPKPADGPADKRRSERPKNPPSKSSVRSQSQAKDLQRWLLGIIGGGMFIGGMLTYLLTGDDSFLVGVLVKVGLVLLTIFLAWPSLKGWTGRIPTYVNVLMLAALIVVAIRPKLVLLVLAGLLITLAVHFGFKFISRKIDRK